MTEVVRESVKVLNECIELQNAKSRDYQNDVSSVKQADYYRLGINSIYDMMHTKMLRLRSLIETAEKSPTTSPKFESLEDTAKDLINYSSFFVSYLRGKIDGQSSDIDMFNRPRPAVVFPVAPNYPIPGSTGDYTKGMFGIGSSVVLLNEVEHDEAIYVPATGNLSGTARPVKKAE